MRAQEDLTLVNKLLRETYRPHTTLSRLTTRPMTDVRAALIRARRFVLDEPMSAFVADLAMSPFIANVARRPVALDAVRHGARLPHPTTWVELDGRAFRRRLIEIYPEAHDATGKVLVPGEEVPRTWGWLFEEHPRDPRAVRMSEFVIDEDDTGAPITPPFQWVWQTSDDPLPWAGACPRAGMIGHGIMGYECPQIGILNEPFVRERDMQIVKLGEHGKPFRAHEMVLELGSAARYAMCLLATLNDVPATIARAEQSRGFVARGSYRKYLDHATVRLSVPARVDKHRLAAKLIAIARRRAHDVRGHWRLYQRGPGVLCEAYAHAWGAADDAGHARCGSCSAWRTWIPAHQRGDASLGYVVHDYSVTHDAE